MAGGVGEGRDGRDEDVITIGSLFSGIGGLDRGVELASRGRVLWQVEKDDWCRRVLAKHWPDVDRSITDVTDPRILELPRVDILAGGPACQDFSRAGGGAGIAGERGRLIFAYESALRGLSPYAALLENVESGKTRWLPHVRLFFEAAGYRTRAVEISAAECGAPHLRKRIIVLALADADRLRELQPRWRQYEERRRAGDRGCEGSAAPLGHADDAGLQGRGLSECERADERLSGPPSGQGAGCAPGDADGRLVRCFHGLPRELDEARWPSRKGEPQQDWEPPRVAPKGAPSQYDRRNRMKAGGNAVVPMVGAVATNMLLDWISEEMNAL